MRIQNIDRQTALLCSAAFMMAAALSTWWTAMPYLLRAIGGTEQHVGLALALHMLGYSVFLVIANRNHQFDCRKATRRAAAIMCLSSVVSMVGVMVAGAKPSMASTLVWLLIGMGALAGMAMAFYWPFLMSWVSSDLEGPALAKRLGVYNGAWSGAVIFGPLVGAGLVDIGHPLPLAATGFCLAMCWILLTGARRPGSHSDALEAVSSIPVHASLTLLWMARFALLCAWGGLAITRSQFALRFTDLGYRPALFGVLMTLCALLIYLVLAGMGRWHVWHGSKTWLLTVPILQGAALLFFAYGSSLMAFGTAMGLQGVAVAISYSVHQYYGAARSTTRSAAMTVHELVIAIATMIGSTPAGYLAYYYGTLSPYWYGITLCAGVLLVHSIQAGRQS